jgi:phospholipase/carboxylesterase
VRDKTYGKLRVRLTGGPDRQGGGDGPLVVLMHGFGAPGNDLVPLWRVLDVPPEVRFAFPEAPIDLGPAAMGGRAWWHIDMARLQREQMTGTPSDRSHEVPDGLSSAHAMLVEALAELTGALQPSRLVLGGFSQGSMLACDVALRTELPLSGLVVFSGTLIAMDEWAPTAARRKGLRTVISHGQADPILPFGGSERLRDFLQNAGLDVRFVPFRGGHEIPPAALDACAKLVREASA